VVGGLTGQTSELLGGKRLVRIFGAVGGQTRVFWSREDRRGGNGVLLLAQGGSALNPSGGGQKLKQVGGADAFERDKDLAAR
jgi:hypothetical protein